jgi:hypothetical protein
MASDVTCNVRITTNGPMQEFASVSLFDSYDRLVKKQYGALVVRIEKGLYRLTIELNENVIEKNLRITGDYNESFELPKTYSSFPLDNFKSTYEYYTAHAVEWSNNFTWTPGSSGGAGTGSSDMGSLFLFFRYPNKEQRSKSTHTSLGKDFFLADKDRTIVTALDSTHIRENRTEGWMAFHAKLPRGQYFLHYDGDPKREMPIYVFKDWQTQVFLTFNRSPIFSTLRISIEGINEGFRNNKTDYYLLEGVMQKFMNGIYYIPEKDLINLAHGKWQNPMMGFLAAYIYLLSERNDREELFSQVVNNLEHAIFRDSAAPDIVVLKVLWKIHLKEVSDIPSVAFPPMLAAGVRSAIKLSSKHPSLIANDSLLEDISCSLYSDSLFTSYVPQAIRTRGFSLRNLVSSVVSDDHNIPYLEGAVADIVRTKFGRDLVIEDIANRLNVPPNLAAKTIQKMLNKGDAGLDKKNLLNKLKNFIR